MQQNRATCSGRCEIKDKNAWTSQIWNSELVHVILLPLRMKPFVCCHSQIFKYRSF